MIKTEINGKICQGLIHYGQKKTFDDKISAEVYLDRFDADIYGRKITIEVVRKIREIRKFASVEELKRQIGKDKKNLYVAVLPVNRQAEIPPRRKK